jgi:tocopherol O-methyltransferase
VASPPDPASRLRRSVERHYDSLAFLYRAFWGEHIHHGLWLEGDAPPAVAQERLVAHLAERAAVRRGERVLDVGCGYGAAGRWLARRLGCRVTGVTISRKQARRARRRTSGDAGAVQIVRADAAALPFAAGAFDVVWVIECIEHLVDKRRFVLDAARLLRPGGRLAICTWQRADGGREAEELVRQVCESFLCPSLAAGRDYIDWCSVAGLEVIHAEDLTAHVQPTWEILTRRISRPWLAPARRLAGRELRRFLDGFPSIARAYRTGAMTYGLLVAARAQGNRRQRPS